MASSTYQVVMQYSQNSNMSTCDQIWEKVNRKEVRVFDRASFHNISQEEHKKVSETFFMTEGGTTHTCRETVIGSVRHMYTVPNGTSFQVNCVKTAHIAYTAEGGKYLSEERVEKIKAIYSKINPMTMPIKLSFFKNSADRLLVGASIVHPNPKNLMLWSFLFWIFRNEPMLNNAHKFLNSNTSQTTLSNFLLHMSQEFALTSNQWDDTEYGNSAIALSIYAYGESRNMWQMCAELNGPSNLVTNCLPVNLALEYLNLVYIPMLEKGESVRWLLEGNSSMPCMKALAKIFDQLSGKKFKKFAIAMNDLRQGEIYEDYFIYSDDDNEDD